MNIIMHVIILRCWRISNLSNYEYICKFIETNFISFLMCFASIVVVILLIKDSREKGYKINKKVVVYLGVCILFLLMPIVDEIIKCKSFLNVNLLPFMIISAVLVNVDFIGCSMVVVAVVYLRIKPRLKDRAVIFLITALILAITIRFMHGRDCGPYDNNSLNLIGRIQYISQYAEDVKNDNTETVYAENIEFTDKYNCTRANIIFDETHTISLIIGRDDIDNIKEMKKSGGIYITYYSDTRIIKSVLYKISNS